MSKLRLAAIHFLIAMVVLAVCQTGSQRAAFAQGLLGHQVHFRVTSATQQLEMITDSSRILTTENDVPRILVNNPEIVRATPLSPNKIQLSALRPGVTQLNIWDAEDNVFTVDVQVVPDARELANALKANFPTAELNVRPLNQSVMITGFVPSPDMVGQIIRVAEDYYPNVINGMKIGGVQTVLLHTKVMEVSRTKLRTVGFDWANFNGDDYVIQSVSGLIDSAASAAGTAVGGGDSVRFGIINPNNRFFAFVEALRENNLVKILAEPTLVTVSGRAASFNSGGEFPIPVPQSLGALSIEYKTFGTRVDYVPIVLGNGRVRLEVRPSVSEIDPTRSVTISGVTVPGLRSRFVDTAVEMNAGQTLALAGLIQNRSEAVNSGIPWLMDMPWFGSAFRRVREQNNEIELLIMVTPEFVDGMDPHQVPPKGPGELTRSPNDTELFFRNYLEVPKCCVDGNCPHCRSGLPRRDGNYEEIVPETSRTITPAAPSVVTPTAPPAVTRIAPVEVAPVAPQPPALDDVNDVTPRTQVEPQTNNLLEITPSNTQAARPKSIGRREPLGPKQATKTQPKVKKVTRSNLFGPIGYDELD